MRLRALVQEVAAAIEIFIDGYDTARFNRTSFILADDCAELAGKLFLMTRDPKWSDSPPKGLFKNFTAITQEVRDAIEVDRPADSPLAQGLTQRFEARRVRRNGFFHSAQLLDLTLHTHDCAEALADLMDYGSLLFPGVVGDDGAWAHHVAGTGELVGFDLLIRLEVAARANEVIRDDLRRILKNQPRRNRAGYVHKSGCEVVEHGNGVHTRLAVRFGGKDLRDRLSELLK